MCKCRDCRSSAEVDLILSSLIILCSNAKSIFYLTVAMLPLLRNNVSVDKPASVINISSIYATLPFANMPTAPKGQGAWSYLASKAAASHLTRSLANKLKVENINVNAIAPGFYPSSKFETK